MTAAGHRGQVDQVAAAVTELAEECFGDGHSAEQVGLDHAPVVIVSFGGEGGEQHDPSVVDQDLSSAELGLDPVGRLDHGVAVGDVGLDGNRAMAELFGQGLDAVGAAGEQGQAEAAGGEGTGGGLPDAGAITNGCGRASCRKPGHNWFS